MYEGDEVSSTKIDMGSQPCKAGYTGEDTPKAVFPTISVVGAIDQMEVDDIASAKKNFGYGGEGQNNAKIPSSAKTEAKRKLYVGSQALGFRSDHMDLIFLTDFNFYVNILSLQIDPYGRETNKVWFIDLGRSKRVIKTKIYCVMIIISYSISTPTFSMEH
ncbi:hypothetical protein UlMin_037755 [Ulmus minor]